MTPRAEVYVVRSTQLAPSGRVTYALIDMAGRLLHVTVPRSLTAGDGPTAILGAVTRVIPVGARS